MKAPQRGNTREDDMRRQGEERAMPIKTCRNCYFVMPAAVRFCRHCRFDFYRERK